MRDCIVVTGAGRSGTSLVTGLLAQAGLRLSEDLIEASAQNPRGSFEDRRIFTLQREMLSRMGPLAVPPPRGWLDHPAVRETEPLLREAVAAGVARSRGPAETMEVDPRPWGFKDPHTAYTLRLWYRIFNAERIAPKIVLCVRDPSAVVTSLMRQYNWDPASAELFWLTKYLAAILDTGADLFVARYERIVGGDLGHVSDLCAHVGLGRDADEARLKAFLDPALDRSGTNAYGCANPAVQRLWEVLQNCVGHDFDRSALVEAAIEVDADVAPYRGWLHEIHRVYRPPAPAAAAAGAAETAALRKSLEEREEALTAARRDLGCVVREHALQQRQLVLAANEIERLRVFCIAADRQRGEAAKEASDLRRLRENTTTQHAAQTLRQRAVRDNARTLAKKAEALQRQVAALTSARAAAATENARALGALKDDLIETRGSASFRLGHIFVRAFARPGRDTLAAPWRILKLVLARRSRQRHPV